MAIQYLNLGPRPEFNLQGTPLMVGGKLYATGGGGNRRAMVAIDARRRASCCGSTASTRARVPRRPLASFPGAACRYWTDGRGDERILYVTIGYSSSRSTPKPGSQFPRSARTASSISKSAS